MSTSAREVRSKHNVREGNLEGEALATTGATERAVELPPYPPHNDHFRTPVHGTVFGQRTEVVHRLHAGDRLILVPDPPGTDDPWVWVHAPGGDVIGHLPPDISRWLVPWMLEGGRCSAYVDKVHGDDVESWRRLVIEVTCRVTNAE
jgi:hypothetical protein